MAWVPSQALQTTVRYIALRMSRVGWLSADDLYQEGWLAILERGREPYAHQLQTAKRHMQHALTRERAQYGITWEGVDREACAPFWRATPMTVAWRYTLMRQIGAHLGTCQGVFPNERQALLKEIRRGNSTQARYAVYRCRRHLRRWLEDIPCTHRSTR